MLRRATENVYIQTAFHVAGGTGLGLALCDAFGSSRPWLAVALMGAAVLGHIIAVTLAARAPQQERKES